MASAVIASQKESGWAHTGKIPYQLNANPNPKKKPKKHHSAAANGVAGHHRELPTVTQTTSGDAYSFNQTAISRDCCNYGRCLTFNVYSYTKSEILKLRKRLSGELEQIRDLQNRINSGQFSNVGNHGSQTKFGKNPGNEMTRVQERQGNGLNNSNFDVMDFGPLLKQCSQIVTKLFRNKFADVFKVPVDAAALGLQDYHHIVKQPMDLGTVKMNLAKNLYPTPCEFAFDVRLTFNNALLYNPEHDPVHGMAEEMLARFEHLFRPIQQKLDGLVKQCRESDAQDFRGNDDLEFQRNEVLFPGNSWSNHNHSRTSPFREKKVRKQKSSPVPAPMISRKVERMPMPMPMQAHSSVSTSSNPPPPSPAFNQQTKKEEMSSPVRAPLQTCTDQKFASSGGIGKQPKPKANDPNKREMTMDEKQKLGMGLQILPQEKMPQLIQIISKRNERLALEDDEIELDIEALDTETLWELDRCVTNCKKTLNKAQRQALMTNSDLLGSVAPSSPLAAADMDLSSDKNAETPTKLNDYKEEDVDIYDDMPVTSFPPVVIEKDEGADMLIAHDQGQNHDRHGNASSTSSGSSTSSSDSSSSSDSESGSSSGSGTDVDEAQS